MFGGLRDVFMGLKMNLKVMMPKKFVLIFFVGDGEKVCYDRVANAGFFLHLAISY